MMLLGGRVTPCLGAFWYGKDSGFLDRFSSSNLRLRTWIALRADPKGKRLSMEEKQ